MAGLELFVRGKEASFGLVIALTCTCEYTLKAVLRVHGIAAPVGWSTNVLWTLWRRRQMGALFMVMITGISRHSSRGGEGKMMENLLRR